MSGLVGVDIGVLDDDFAAGGNVRRGFRLAGEEGCAVRSPVEADIDVTVSGNFHGRDAGDGADLIDQFGGYFPGRLAELLRELEGDRDGHFAEIALAWLFDGNGLIEAVEDLDVRAEGARNLLLDGMEHGKYEYSEWNVGARQGSSVATANAIGRPATRPLEDFSEGQVDASGKIGRASCRER